MSEAQNGTPQPRAGASRAGAAELHLDMGTELFITPQGSTERTPCKVIGLSTNEYIIARMPVIPGFTSRFPNGCAATIRYLFQGNIYGFKTTLLNHTLKPAPMLFIEYPYTIEKVELRKHQRLQCSLVGRLHTRLGVMHLVTLDMSHSGCRVAVMADKAVQNDLQNGEEVMVELLFRPEGVEYVSGTVRNIQKMDRNLLLGLQFTFRDKPVETLLETFLEQVGDIYAA